MRITLSLFLIFILNGFTIGQNSQDSMAMQGLILKKTTRIFWTEAGFRESIHSTDFFSLGLEYRPRSKSGFEFKVGILPETVGGYRRTFSTKDHVRRGSAFDISLHANAKLISIYRRLSIRGQVGLGYLHVREEIGRSLQKFHMIYPALSLGLEQQIGNRLLIGVWAS